MGETSWASSASSQAVCQIIISKMSDGFRLSLCEVAAASEMTLKFLPHLVGCKAGAHLDPHEIPLVIAQDLETVCFLQDQMFCLRKYTVARYHWPAKLRVTVFHTQIESEAMRRVLGRRNLFIQVRDTPNPKSLMFLPGSNVLESGFKEFDSFASSQVSPLARELFAIAQVDRVMYGPDFISVTVKDENEWHHVRPAVFSAITSQITMGADLFRSGTIEEDSLVISDDDDDTVAAIKELIETRIRPAVREDGGDIIYRGWDQEKGIVSVQLAGSCVGCSSSTVTLKMGIEKMLIHYVPEVKQVEDLTDHDEVTQAA